jgi:hypothetical protein
MFFLRKKKNFVVWANCQGEALVFYLKKIPEIRKKYKFFVVTNYRLISNKLEIPYKKLNIADVFLYQPIDPVHGKYSTENLSKYLKPDCVQISFPYIYNNGLWPFYLDHANGHMNQIGIETLSFFDSGKIKELKKQGKSDSEIIEMFITNKISFDFKNKFFNSLDILRSKEKNLDIKVADFIEKNYKVERLFYNFQHPRQPILIECIKQIMHILNITTNKSLPVSKYYLYDKKFLPVMPIVAKELELNYFDHGSDAYFKILLAAVLASGKFDGFLHKSDIRMNFYNVQPPIKI